VTKGWDSTIMVRYLTPAKICLLVLLELYVEEAVPSEATLPVLTFITSHLLDRDSAHAVDRSSRWTKAERTASLIVTIKDFEKLLSSYPFLMGMPGRRLWDQFLDKLWRISSLDTLHQFMNNLPQLLAKTKAELQREMPGQSPESKRGIELSRNSLLGSFVRRARVELSRLPWHDVTTLWKDFVRYRQPTLIYMQRKNLTFGELAFDSVLSTGQHEGLACERAAVLASIVYGDMLDGDKGARLPVSTDDIEVLLEFQIEQMQS
jgi:anaphase-promoting complex subunit 5